MGYCCEHMPIGSGNLVARVMRIRTALDYGIVVAHRAAGYFNVNLDENGFAAQSSTRSSSIVAK